MTPSERHAEVAGAFTRCADGVTDWDAPAPVDGWVARDVVRHLTGWLPGFLEGGGVPFVVSGPPVDDDPAGAWRAHVAAVRSLLDDPGAGRTLRHPMVGDGPLDAAVDQYYTTDVFLHTWDLARATGQDDRLDPDACAALLAGMEPWDQVLRDSGQYGPKVPVSEDASAQDRLLGFIGRDPAWRA